jgi:hypothetical protein
MSIDPKIRRGPSSPSLSTPTATPAKEKKPALADKAPRSTPETGHSKASTFERTSRSIAEYSGAAGDLSGARTTRGGIADDSVGVGDDSGARTTRGGIADDSVGVGDDSGARTRRGGVADDSVGVGDDSGARTSRGGVADDSVGTGDNSGARTTRGGVADDSVGTGDNSGARTTRGGVADDSVGTGDPSGARSTRGGVADDSVGTGSDSGARTRRGGVTDDSVGTNDPSGARTRRGGVTDDSVGRSRRGGVTDDSVGVTVGPDTNPADVAAREALYKQIETPSYLTKADAAPAKAPDVTAIGRALPGVLSSARASALVTASQNDPIAGARLQSLLSDTSALPASSRSALFDTVATEGPRSDAARVIDSVTQSAAWTRLSASQKADLTSVMTTASPAGLQYLGSLVEQAPQLLTAKDSQGGTLVSNLAQIATQPLNAGLYKDTSTSEVLDDVLRDVVNPNRIDQGTSDTCTVTSMQWELVNDSPAEYARLMSGLAGPQGKATMMGGGTLKTSPGDASLNSAYDRTVSSQLFQSAAMDDGNGNDVYDPVKDKSTKADGTVYQGLDPQQQTHILGQLFGIKYSVHNLYSPAEGQKVLDSLQGFDASKQVNRPVLLEIDQGKLNHTVTLEKVTTDKVFFRDPYGLMRSMPASAFPTAVVGIHQPMAGQ